MNRKGWILVFSILALIAIILLASGLRSVQFQPGRPLPNVMPTTVQAPVELPEQTVSTPLWKVLLLWGIFVLNMFLFFLLLSPEARKRILRQMIRLALTAVAIYIALKNYYLKVAEQEANQNPQANAGADLPSMNDIGPAFHPPQMTPWATFLISLGVLLAIFVLLWVGYRWWQRRYGRRPARTLMDIAAVARSSLKKIASGSDWGDVIIQSYVQMGEVVSTTRGLHRAEAMTPREFAERLQMTGLPAESVLRLTRLFESVRYGAHPSSQKEINEAVACLASILSACGVAQ